jgi:molybdenum cofactor synthesis domain-containing protein
MEKRAIMQSANPVLPPRQFAAETLPAPRQAIEVYLSRVAIGPTGIEQVALADALGRILATSIAADADYPAAPRSTMDGFALQSKATPGTFHIAGDVAMGERAALLMESRSAVRIPTGGILPHDADAVVPFEEARIDGDTVTIDEPVLPGANVSEPGSDMRRGELILAAPRRIRAAEIGVLASLGATRVEVYRRPTIAVLSSGDELVEPSAVPSVGEVRDSNRYVIAASLQAMGAIPQHYPTLRDESGEFETALGRALAQCDAVTVTGGSSVGHRDRLPDAVTAIATPGIVVHGLRVKPGKPTLLGAHGTKPILGLPGNPTSALMMLEAVVSPIVAALCGAPLAPSTVAARLATPARSREGWTWYIPVRLENDGDVPAAHPLPLRSFSVSLTARADGFIVMNERDDDWPAGTGVTVHRFFGG